MAACAAVLTTACTTQSVTAFEQGAVSAPATWRAATEHARPVQDGWLAPLQDQYLTDLVDEALLENADLSQARGRLNRARALLKQSRSDRLPSLSFESSSRLADGGRTRSDKSSYDAGLTASWEIDLWGRLSKAEEANRYAASSAGADLKAVRQLVAANTAQAYFLLIEAGKLAEVERSNLASLEETLGFVSIQFDRGLRSSADIALIRADVETARATLDRAEQTQRRAARAIEVLIGRYPGAIIDASSKLPTRPPQQTIGKPAEILERRPDVSAAKFTLLSQYARTQSAKAELLPRLSTQAVLDGNSATIADLFNPSALATSLLFNSTQTLFDGGRRNAQLAGTEAEAEIALATYQALVLDAYNEVETELDRGGVLTRRESYLVKALAEAEDALQFSRFRYELGESDLLNVLSIQQRVASLQADLARTQRERLDQYVSLALALGRDT